MSDVVRHATYTVTVGIAYRGEVVSPISGKDLVAYGDSPIDAKRKIDALIFGEAEERGLIVVRDGVNYEAEEAE